MIHGMTGYISILARQTADIAVFFIDTIHGRSNGVRKGVYHGLAAAA